MCDQHADDGTFDTSITSLYGMITRSIRCTCAIPLDPQAHRVLIHAIRTAENRLNTNAYYTSTGWALRYLDAEVNVSLKLEGLPQVRVYTEPNVPVFTVHGFMTVSIETIMLFCQSGYQSAARHAQTNAHRSWRSVELGKTQQWVRVGV